MEYIANDINCGDEEDEKNCNDEMQSTTATLPDAAVKKTQETMPETSVDHDKLLDNSLNDIIESDPYYQQGRKGLSDETVQVVQEYIANLKALKDSSTEEKLPEHPRKYEINAGNCVTFSDPVYDPNNEKYKTIVDKFRDYIPEE